MTFESIQEKLKMQFAENVYDFSESFGILNFYVHAAHNLKVLRYLKEENEFAFTYLNDLTAVHYPDKKEKELEVVYLLQNIARAQRIRIKVSLNITKPEIFTATSLFETANWLEREAYDFFGVQFIGHPNLIRIMNVDEMDYFPLRKEYQVEDQTRIDKDDAMFGR